MVSGGYFIFTARKIVNNVAQPVDRSNSKEKFISAINENVLVLVYGILPDIASKSYDLKD